MADPVAAEPTPSNPAAASPAPTPAVTPPAAATPPVAAAPVTPPVVTPPVAATPPAAPAVATPPLPAPVVPEKYDFAAVKLPEGMALDVPLLTAMEPLFKKHGLTQEAASELVAEHAKALQAIETKKEADFKTWMAGQMTQHQAALKTEFGLAYDQNIATAQRGMARYCSPAMKAILDETGLGQHPEFVKAFLQIGKSVTEDVPPTPGAPANSGKSAAQVLYGGTPSH